MFVNAFPLAHLFALACNTMRIRVDAVRILKYHKRPVPRIDKDIGLWAHVVYFITRVSVFTNGFMIAMSPRFIPRILFYVEDLTNANGGGFLHHALSKFDTRDFERGTEPERDVRKLGDTNYCYYFGYKEPPESTKKYTYTMMFWKVTAAKLCFIIGYYMLANLIINIVQWIIPSVPAKVAEKIQMENYHINRAIIKQEKKNK